MESFVASREIREATFAALQRRGVRLEEIADLTLFLQTDYVPGLTHAACLESVRHVLEKREVQNAILTGVALDELAQQRQLEPPLQAMIETDESLYGVDEILALSILNIYGSIGYTNYGYIDKLKVGVLQRLNDKSTGEVHAFLDDLVGAVAAAAASRIAHRHRSDQEAEQGTSDALG
ncbi:MAG: phosphatidylglycerophosphatase A [Firmicutes bacterium]|nr:phosphatidylglycerophosphatase A [Bacillota bacterium]